MPDTVVTHATDIRCQCCGAPGGMLALSITFAKNGESEILCSTCERLIDEGLLRPEEHDGELRYRQWHFQPMKPGKLLPKAL